MDGLGFAFALAFSILYPLAISMLVWRWRLSSEPLKPVLLVFIVAAVMFYVAYVRKVYMLLFSGLTLYTVDLIATGFIEEAAKLLVLLIPTVRNRLTLENGTFYGLIAGFGFGAGEAVLVLSGAAFEIPVLIDLVVVLYFLKPLMTGLLIELIDFLVSYIAFSVLLAASGPTIFSLHLLAIYERGVVVLLHGALTGIVGWGLARRETVKFYLVAVGLHILVDFFAVLYALQVAGALVVEAAVTVITVTTLLYIVLKSK